MQTFLHFWKVHSRSYIIHIYDFVKHGQECSILFELPVHATNMDIMSRIGNIFHKEPLEYILDKFSIDIFQLTNNMKGC